MSPVATNAQPMINGPSALPSPMLADATDITAPGDSLSVSIRRTFVAM
jgi:hypothetical protein